LAVGKEPKTYTEETEIESLGRHLHLFDLSREISPHIPSTPAMPGSLFCDHITHVADNYIALFSHFIPCGVWEAVYIIEGLLQNLSDVKPDTVHADTQGQSFPVFGLAFLLGFDLLPRIRNWNERTFFRADPETRYTHIDALSGSRGGT
jgi:hypothetical protein